jgi:hypothetical protein
MSFIRFHCATGSGRQEHAIVRFGSIVLKKSVFTNHRSFAEALVRRLVKDAEPSVI